MNPSLKGAIGLVLLVLGLKNIPQLMNWGSEEMLGANTIVLVELFGGGWMFYSGFFGKKAKDGSKPPPLPKIKSTE
jgi:hypothetical protein